MNALRAFILSDLEGGGGGPIDDFDDRSALKALRAFFLSALEGGGGALEVFGTGIGAIDLDDLGGGTGRSATGSRAIWAIFNAAEPPRFRDDDFGCSCLNLLRAAFFFHFGGGAGGGALLLPEAPELDGV